MKRVKTPKQKWNSGREQTLRTGHKTNGNLHELAKRIIKLLLIIIVSDNQYVNKCMYFSG